MKVALKKAEGSAILITMVMGAVMLSLGLTALGMVISDARVAQDFVLSERAYFAAESGMEEALFLLKRNPVENITGHAISLDEEISQSAEVQIGNLVSEFSFSLPPFRSKKFRLKREIPDESESTTDYELADQFTYADRFTIHVDDQTGIAGGTLHWKIICSQSFQNDTRPTRTVSLQASEQISTFTSGQPAEELIGNWDTFELLTNPNDGTQYYASVTNPSGIRSAAGEFLEQADLDGQSCFYSLTNNSPDKTLSIKVVDTSSDDAGMSPYQTKIISRGSSGDRHKTIEFNYVQKNLGELFDFVFFHTGN